MVAPFRLPKPRPAPWVLLATDPLAGMAVRAAADVVAVLALADGTEAVAGLFVKDLRGLAALAELLAAALPRPIGRPRAERVVTFFMDDKARELPLAAVHRALGLDAGAG